MVKSSMATRVTQAFHDVWPQRPEQRPPRAVITTFTKSINEKKLKVSIDAYSAHFRPFSSLQYKYLIQDDQKQIIQPKAILCFRIYIYTCLIVYSSFYTFPKNMYIFGYHSQCVNKFLCLYLLLHVYMYQYACIKRRLHICLCFCISVQLRHLFVFAFCRQIFSLTLFSLAFHLRCNILKKNIHLF